MRSYFIIWGEDFKNNFISKNSSFPGEKLFSGEMPFFWGGEAILLSGEKNSSFPGEKLFSEEKPFFRGEAIFWEKPFSGRSNCFGENPFSGRSYFLGRSHFGSWCFCYQ